MQGPAEEGGGEEDGDGYSCAEDLGGGGLVEVGWVRRGGTYGGEEHQPVVPAGFLEEDDADVEAEGEDEERDGEDGHLDGEEGYAARFGVGVVGRGPAGDDFGGWESHGGRIPLEQQIDGEDGWRG